LKNNSNIKVIAFYLPQFHRIPENDDWWGEGFTEWVNVKGGKSFYHWQVQPRIPLNNNYYCLLDGDTQVWQAELAKKYGIYGFCYYHYWFDGHMLLEKPMESMLKNDNVNIPFCICWANEDWTNAWVSPNADILISQTYGNEDEWVMHYKYLSDYFKDRRYIVEDNMPLMIIYRPEIILCMNQMIDCWNKLAIQDGFAGLKFAYQSAGLDYPVQQDNSKFFYDIEMQPMYARIAGRGMNRQKARDFTTKMMRTTILTWVYNSIKKITGPKILDYDYVWETILATPPLSTKSLPCAFVDFDNTARRKENGWLFKGVSVEKFKKYFFRLAEKTINEYHADKIFIFSWNEWAEGGYLEPDEYNRYGYLEVILDVISHFKKDN